MKNKHMNNLNLFLLLILSLNILAAVPSHSTALMINSTVRDLPVEALAKTGAWDVDITQKGATSKIIKKDEVFFTGVVKIPSCKNADIELCMCYNGDILKIKKNDNLFMIKDSRKDRINILFTSSENFSVDSQDNTILFFKIENKNTYRFFELLKKLKETKNITKNTEKKHCWEITESDLPKKEDKVVVPLDTLIIPIDPSKIEISFDEMCSKQGSKIVNLPTIVIEGQNFCDLEEQINKCCLAFMNIKPFHTKQNKREVRQDNLKVCIVN